MKSKGGFSDEAVKVAEAGGGPATNEALANNARLDLENMPEMAG